MELIILVTASIIFLCLFLSSTRKPQPQLVIDEVTQDVINGYNAHLEQFQTISNDFISHLNKLQREIVLNRDGYSNQKCIYLVDEFNDTSDILTSKFKEIGSLINTKRYKEANQQILYLDDDLDYLKSLLKTLKEIKIEPHSFDSIFNVTNDDVKKPEVEFKEKETKYVSYFSDCKNKDDLIVRYKALVKVFHPDSKAGNEAIFKEIKDEFDIKLQEINSRGC